MLDTQTSNTVLAEDLQAALGTGKWMPYYAAFLAEIQDELGRSFINAVLPLTNSGILNPCISSLYLGFVEASGAGSLMKIWNRSKMAWYSVTRLTTASISPGKSGVPLGR